MRPDRPDLAPWQERLLTLNRRQTRALVMGIVGFILMGLFPPWEHMYINELGAWYDRPAGFHFILSPPEQFYLSTYMGCTVNWTQMFVQWVLVVGVTMAYVWRFRDSLGDPLTPRPRNRPPTIYR